MTTGPLATGTLPAVRALLGKLEATRGRRAIFFQSTLYGQAVPPLYECLRRTGRTDAIDLVLSTGGGTITSTRQIAMLLREFTDHLTILVPHRARSAGTLLCLGADDLVLGPMAELGPVDATMDSDGVPAPDAPGVVSAQDIRAFRSMAQDWFGVERAEDRLQVLGLLATRFFPTSLSSFYRFDRLVREVAAELLTWQLPGDEHAGRRDQIVDKLVSGYHSHDVILSRRDVRALGLRAADATPDEEPVLWALAQAVPSLRRPADPGAPPAEGTGAVIVTTDVSAAEVVQRPAGRDGEDGDGRPPRRPDLRWEIFD
jgi:Serine dehydrogenase proteinase